jgi:hypothetical protein
LGSVKEKPEAPSPLLSYARVPVWIQPSAADSFWTASCPVFLTSRVKPLVGADRERQTAIPLTGFTASFGNGRTALLSKHDCVKNWNKYGAVP